MTHQSFQIEQQCHGYRGGHQLLGSSVRLSREDQDTIDRLSDISGSLRPGEHFAPYLTCYPLPSATYYVIARTWQDLEARRAGCVLTRSFLVLLSDWVHSEGIPALVKRLDPVNRDDLSVNAFTFSQDVAVDVPEVPLSQTLEIVEALFLEDRKPLVVFGSPEADTIIVRLLTALWPALKRAFSACSFALGPRSVSGKSFDLVFSPRDSRARFANWEGRRVDGAGVRETAARHRWSLATARMIFVDPEPSLTKLDTLGVLARDPDGDGSQLRLSLLWNDLLDQLKTTPSAVLGMLDILHSQRGEIPYDISNAVSSALEQARSLPAPKLFEFLVPLCRKLIHMRIPIHLGIQLQMAVKDAVSAEPKAALSTLASVPPGNQLAIKILFAGTADGITVAKTEFLGNRLYDLITNDQLRSLLFSSSGFLKALIGDVPGNTDRSWTARLSQMIESEKSSISPADLARVFHTLNTNQQVPLLEACLSATKNDDLMPDIRLLWETTGFRCTAFDEPLVRRARSLNCIADLRHLLIHLPDSAANQRLLDSSLSGTTDDLVWVLHAKQLPSPKRAQMMSLVLSRADGPALAQIACSMDLMEEVVSGLSAQAVQPATEAYLKILSWTQFDINRVLPIATLILRTYSGMSEGAVLDALLSKGLRYASAENNENIHELLCNPNLQISPDALIDNSLSEESSPRRISDNIALLNTAPHRIRQEVLRYVDNISYRLSRNHPERLTDSGIVAWAAIIQDSGEINPIGQLRAADVALSFAFDNLTKAVSPLVVVSFPLIYRELKQGHDAPPFWSRLFSDWDRCKTLRKELVAGFTGSHWPKLDFFRSAALSGDLKKIIARLLKEKSGSAYLSALVRESNDLDPQERRHLEEVLSTLNPEDPKEDER